MIGFIEDSTQPHYTHFDPPPPTEAAAAAATSAPTPALRAAPEPSNAIILPWCQQILEFLGFKKMAKHITVSVNPVEVGFVIID